MATKTVILKDEIDKVCKKLGKEYKTYKDSEKDKSNSRVKFFKLATQAVQSEDKISQKIDEVEAEDEDTARDLIAKRNPAWTIDVVRVHPDKEGYFEAIIEENPEFMPYSVEVEGWAYARQIKRGNVYVDDELLKDNDPDLYFKVTEWPNEGFIADLLYNSGVHHREFTGEYEGNDTPFFRRDWVAESAEEHGVTRRLKDLETLDPELLGLLQRYIFEGKPQVVLAPPKKLTSE